VDRLRLRVPRGRVYGCLGPNGAGKTTTLHLLLGLLPADSGTATIAGIDVRRDPTEVRRRCGALLEHHGLYERLSAQENLVYHARLRGADRPTALAQANEALARLGWWNRRDDRIGGWSKGMKQRLAIARARLHEPQVLFLDEPTNGFDPKAAADFRDEVRRTARDGVTVFLTTHNLHEAEQVCDEVAVLRDGHVVASGTPEALGGATAPVVEVHGSGWTPTLLSAMRRRKDVTGLEDDADRLVLRLRGTGHAAPIVKALVLAGVRIEEVRRHRESLESKFMEILRKEDP
jgi:ABC-2 type transport system ATP-binding protein